MAFFVQGFVGARPAGFGARSGIYSRGCLPPGLPALTKMAGELTRTGSIADMRDKVRTFTEFTEVAGLPDIMELEERYGVPEDQRAGL